MIDSTMPWTLHAQLEADTAAIGDLRLSRLLLANDANYPWLLLVPRREGASEIIDLSEADQIELAVEIARVSRALKAVTACDKLNVAALGNVPARDYDPAERERLVTALRGELSLER
jgi:diadenosine tetraphosphate (Ap4A) HIT family hydrolase